MLDFVLGLFLAALLVRGWVRGFVREILDLVGLVVGLWIAFKLSEPLGDFITGAFGTAPEVARIGSGIALFVLFGATLSVAAHYLSKVMRLPGLNMVNRVGGSAVALAWGVALVVVIVNVVSVFPIPDSWEDEMDESTVVQAIAGPGAFPQELFERLAGDSLLGALATIQGLFGTSRVVPEPQEIVAIPRAGSDEIRQVRDEADDVLGQLNEFRAGVGVGALQPSAALTLLAEARAVAMYRSGEMFRSDCRAEADANGVRVVTCVDVVALAGTALGALEGMKESDSAREALEESAADRTGISVVEGPTGRLLLVALAG
jgi:membrane protein required for colicin V production